MKQPINILVDFEAMYFYSNNKADQFRVIESAFIIKQNNVVLTQFVSKIHLANSYAQRANKRVLKLLQLNKDELATFPSIAITTKALLKIEKRLKSMNKQQIQFICWGSEDKKYLSALIDQIHEDSEDVLDKKWWLALPWLRLDSKFRAIMKRPKGTALSKAFKELKSHRLVRGELPENIHNALDDCRILEKILHSFEVENFQRLFALTQPHQTTISQSEQQSITPSPAIVAEKTSPNPIMNNDIQQLSNEIDALKQEIIALKGLVTSLINQTNENDSCPGFSLKLSQ